MLRYILTGVGGVIAGAGVVVLLYLVASPIPSSLTCSVNGSNKVVDCVDQDGNAVKSPHEVTIR